jgi:hypothetical protein
MFAADVTELSPPLRPWFGPPLTLVQPWTPSQGITSGVSDTPPGPSLPGFWASKGNAAWRKRLG